MATAAILNFVHMAFLVTFSSWERYFVHTHKIRTKSLNPGLPSAIFEL